MGSWPLRHSRQRLSKWSRKACPVPSPYDSNSPLGIARPGASKQTCTTTLNFDVGAAWLLLSPPLRMNWSDMSLRVPRDLPRQIDGLQLVVAFTKDYFNRIQGSTSQNSTMYDYPIYSSEQDEFRHCLDEMNNHSLCLKKVLGAWPAAESAVKAYNVLLIFLRDTNLANVLWKVVDPRHHSSFFFFHFLPTFFFSLFPLFQSKESS